MLSIIIPTLNEAERLQEPLLHLQARCPGADVIVVDGGSWDCSRDLVQRFPRVRFVASAQGRAKQMNAGARAARGDVLLFLHADTRLPAGAHVHPIEEKVWALPSRRWRLGEGRGTWS